MLSARYNNLFFFWGLLCFFPFWGMQAKEVLVEYFYQPHCQECQEINQLVLPALNNEMQGKFILKKYNLSQEENFLVLLTILDSLNDTSNANVYMIVNRRKVFGGIKAIQDNIKKTVAEEYMADRQDAAAVDAVTCSKYTIRNRIKLVTVITAGFLDGINPCVFVTLVFFMSVLSAAKVTIQKLYLIGTVYILACFSTYFLLGIGLYKILSWSSNWGILKTLLNYIMATFLIILSLFTLRDVIAFSKSQNSADIAIQLPEKIKERIHSLIRSLRNRSFVISGIFSLGVAVTFLEGICTGQVYVPTIVFLIESQGVFSSWILYLFLYNLIFILPLCGVFLAVLTGVSVLSLVSLTKKQIIVSKLLLAIFFILMAFLILYL